MPLELDDIFEVVTTQSVIARTDNIRNRSGRQLELFGCEAGRFLFHIFVGSWEEPYCPYLGRMLASGASSQVIFYYCKPRYIFRDYRHIQDAEVRVRTIFATEKLDDIWKASEAWVTGRPYPVWRTEIGSLQRYIICHPAPQVKTTGSNNT